MLADVQRAVDASWWAPFLAFAAGVVSFASPCVFPLVPGYVSFVSGGQAPDEGRPVVPILLFVGGFAAVFTSLGAFSHALVPVFKSQAGQRISGVVIALFGVGMILYGLRLGWPGMYAERRPFLDRVRPGPAWAFPLGAAFAVGWTPCTGPVLGAILALAASQGAVLRGVYLMAAYSLGLGVPFLLIGVGMRRALRGLTFVRRNYHWFAGVSGGVMLVIGVLLVTGLWQRVLAPLLSWIGRFTPAL